VSRVWPQEAASSSTIFETTDATKKADARALEERSRADKEKLLRVEAQNVVAKLDSNSLSALVRLLADDASVSRIRSIDALVQSEQALNSDSRRCTDYKRVVNTCIDGVIDAAADGDEQRVAVLQEGALEHLTKLQKHSMSQSGRKDGLALAGLKSNIANAWRAAKRVGDYVTAAQVLSMLITPKGHGLPFVGIMQLATSRVEIEVGSPVLVLEGEGNLWYRGVCIGKHDDEHDTTVYDVQPPIGPPRGRQRRPCQAATGVSADRVEHANSLVCTLHEVKTAAHLVAMRHAGARPDAIARTGWTRMSVLRAVITAEMLRSRSTVTRCDGGAATARTGRQWMLKAGTTVLLERLNKLLAKVRIIRSFISFHFMSFERCHRIPTTERSAACVHHLQRERCRVCRVCVSCSSRE
jgi:hypothetical protein